MKLVKANDRTSLLLDSAWMPINVLTARATFHHFLKDRIIGVDKNTAQFNFENWFENASLYKDNPALRSASNVWPIPTLCVVTDKFFKKPRKKEYSFDELCLFYKNTCQICLNKFPKKLLSIDHVCPKSKHGHDMTSNKILACKSCNSKKGDKYPYYNKEGKQLKGTKIPPNYIFIDDGMKRNEWNPFLFS